MRSLAVALAAFCMCFSAIAEKPPQVDYDKLRSALDARFRDSQSARFRDAVLRKSIDGTAWEICGLVNAKNAYGGYAGYTHFVGMIAGNAYVVTAVGDNAEAACRMR